MSSPATPVPAWIDLRRQFEEAVSAPAPERSLQISQAETLTRDLLRDNNAVFFGEIHDDVNHKFLADNPGFFREAAAQGARYVFVELKIESAPLLQNHFEGRISTQQLEKSLAELNRQRPHTGDTGESYARQTASMAETARSNGMQLTPSDFRYLRESNYSSDVVGIPDIQDRQDEVRNQTRLSLESFRESTGTALPSTLNDFIRMDEIHNARIAALPAETRSRYYQDQSARSDEWSANGEDTAALIRHNDALQFNYYSRLVEPGEKALFFGGASHYSGDNTIDDHIEQNGYGAVAGIELRSDAGMLHENYVAQLSRAENLERPAAPDRFDYRIQTERGVILDQNGQSLPEAPAAPEEAAPTPRRPAAPGFSPGA